QGLEARQNLASGIIDAPQPPFQLLQPPRESSLVFCLQQVAPQKQVAQLAVDGLRGRFRWQAAQEQPECVDLLGGRWWWAGLVPQAPGLGPARGDRDGLRARRRGGRGGGRRRVWFGRARRGRDLDRGGDDGRSGGERVRLAEQQDATVGVRL